MAGESFTQYVGPFKLTVKPEVLKQQFPEQYAAIEAKAKQAAMDYTIQKATELRDNPIFWVIVTALGLVIVGQMLPKGRRA